MADHPLFEAFELFSSGERYRFPRAKCNRFPFSFVLIAKRMLNLHQT